MGAGVALGPCLVAPPPCACDSEGARAAGQGEAADEEEEDEDFDFEFAKPPVTPAAMDLQSSVSVSGGLLAGRRPVADLVTSSTFTLPVERGWPRDTNSAEDVARSMCAVVADRLPRWAADHCELDLHGAPLRQRSGEGWPPAGGEGAPATLRLRRLPAAVPPLLTLRQLDDEDRGAVGYLLGGLLCAGAPVRLRVSCEPTGVFGGEGEERLDLRVTTSLEGFPIAGRGWLVGGRWWFKRVRLPLVRRLLEGFHGMLHDQMMLHYVAALSG